VSIISEGIDDYFNDDEMGFEKYGVLQVRRQVEEAKKQIDEINGRITSTEKDPARLKAWESFMRRWTSFYTSTQGVEGAFNQFKDETYEKTLNFQSVAEASEKGWLTPPTLPAAPSFKGAKKVTQQKPAGGGGGITLNPSLNPSIGFDIPWWAILKWGALGAGGIFIGYQAWKHFTPAGKVVGALDKKDEPQTTE
jgi:hypothetical protein